MASEVTPRRLRDIGDFLLAGLAFAVAALLFIGAAELPPPRFEPLGSAAVPRILGAVLILLGALVALRAVRQRGEPAAETDRPPYPLRGLWTLVALLAYAGALDLLRLPFALATGGFLAVMAAILTGGNPRGALIYGLAGLALGQGLTLILARFLHISIG